MAADQKGDSSFEDVTDEGNWILYKDRVDWKDVEPVSQDDGPNPVVAIAYSEKFRDVHDYFRAILLRKEISERALLLTVDALELNPANYTVWQYRRTLLSDLHKDLKDELSYIDAVIEDNPKNYQVWHHRRVIVELSNDASRELRFTESILDQDAKNYHAWQHRQWVIRTFSLYSDELRYVEELLKEDVRNNSAWNQRYFVVSNTTGFKQDVIEKEVAFTLQKIKSVMYNESAWNYLRGVLGHLDAGISGSNEVLTFCDDLYEAANRSPYLLALLVDICEEKLHKGENNTKWNLERAIQLCHDLGNEHDSIRREYWNYTARNLALRFQDNSTTIP